MVAAKPSLYQFAYWVGITGLSDYANQECACFVPNTWTHVAGVFDADAHTLSFYRNGELTGSTATTQNIRAGSSTLYFGRWGNDDTRRFIGDLDDFVIYNRVLVLAEIQRLAREKVPISGTTATAP